MMYILSEGEYNTLKEKQEAQAKLNQKTLGDLCIKIADTMPVKVPWAKDEPPEPWHCIVTLEKEGQEHCCDECPVQKFVHFLSYGQSEDCAMIAKYWFHTLIGLFVLAYFAIAFVGYRVDAARAEKCADGGGVFVHDMHHRPLCITGDAATQGEMP